VTKSCLEPIPFFSSLARWAEGGRGWSAFQAALGRSSRLSPGGLAADLYRETAGFWLERLGLAPSPGAAVWEWRPLYALAQELDPAYFTRGQIEERLGGCPPMPGAAKEALTEMVCRCLRFQRELSEAPPPSVWLDEQRTTRWAEVLAPLPGGGWEGLSLLRRVGLVPLGGGAGWRAWVRHRLGEAAPLTGSEALTGWLRILREQAPKAGLEPHQAAFLAEALGGDHTGFGVGGVCGQVPRCGECPAAPDCRLAHAPLESITHPAALLARLKGGQAPRFSNGQLLRAVLGEDGPWVERLEGVALRELALKEVARDFTGDGETYPEADPPEKHNPHLTARLAAFFELSRRFNSETLAPGQEFRSSKDIYNHFRMSLRDAAQEYFLVVMLDARNRFMGDYTVSKGTLEKSLVHPREVFSEAIHRRAAAVVVVHNHPSGDPSPSKEDINVTLRLVETGNLVGIPMKDHIIIGKNTFVSLNDQRLLHPGQPR